MREELHAPNYIDPRQIANGFDIPFRIDVQKVWKLQVPTEVVPIEDLLWILDVPFWANENDNITVTANDVLKNPDAYPEHRDRIQNADTSFPLDLMQNKNGRWMTISGLHRLAQLVMHKRPTARVRKIPPEMVHLTARDE
ncbi:MAG: hypothetical protein NUV84_01110 [Candidatus Uhrbacteria bacterium]|nr:hypothetical protein [Candidatus Uhrbacteria bacterium]